MIFPSGTLDCGALYSDFFFNPTDCNSLESAKYWAFNLVFRAEHSVVEFPFRSCCFIARGVDLRLLLRFGIGLRHHHILRRLNLHHREVGVRRRVAAYAFECCKSG